MADEIYTPDNLVAGNDYPALVEEITLLAGQSLARGAVLGAVTKEAPDPAEGTPAAGNVADTGTLDAVELGPDAKIGTYTVACVSVPAGVTTLTVPETGTADAGNTAGSGTMTGVADGGAVKAGVYTITCIDAAVSGSEVFKVIDPDGLRLDDATVGVAYASRQIDFTLNDATDFEIGDQFTVTVTAETANHAGGTFTVVDPDGLRLKDATVGVAYETSQIAFEITAGTVDFSVGESFTFEVTAPAAEKMKLVDKTAVDGSQDPRCILAEAVDAALADQVGVAYQTGVFNPGALVLADGTLAADIEEALRARQIFLRDVRHF